MSKDIARNLAKGQSIDPASYAATKTGDEISLVGALNPVMILVNIGALSGTDADNYFTFTVTQATTSGGTFTAADSSQYDAVGSWDRIINADTEANAPQAFNFSMKPGYPYIKVVATETGTVTSAIFGATVLKQVRHKPAVS